MPLLTLRNIELGFGAEPVLDRINLTIDAGERLCLVGRNGAGKSTLMKLIAGELHADDGLLEQAPGLRIARLAQEVPGHQDGTVAQQVADGLGDTGRLLSEYDTLSQTLGDANSATMDRFEVLQQQIDQRDGWRLAQQVETVLSRLGLDGQANFADLSGGMKRRVLLAQALVQEPDILLLDEPTNHLDIDSIRWLEEFLKSWHGTVLFITHDRAFLRALATRIIELDRGQLTSWPGNYDQYLRGKQAQLDAEQKAFEDFDKKLSQEERWIRQGIKARRTRNEGRVRALKTLRDQRAERRDRTGQAKLAIQQSDASGKLVIEAKHLSHQFAGESLFTDLSLTILRGDRIGLIGANGCGKSTLLNILLGRLQPAHGEIKLGSQLQIARYDQLRETLDEEKSIIENVVEGSDFIEINGQSRHIIGYLQDFLFEPARCRQPVKALSGGERNRLLLARLFSRPFNLLVLDEPTNDLDADTLDLLEEQLIDYQGTLLLVSHDREFLDNVVTSTLVFEHGTVNEYVGGYQDWLRQRPAQPARQASTGNLPAQPPSTPAAAPTTSKKARLSYQEQQEIAALPGRIEQLEQDIKALQQQLSDPAFLQQGSEQIAAAGTQLATLEQAHESAFNRWAELDGNA